MMELVAGSDFRRPELRREVFLRFYDFHLRHGTHPGLVWALFPWLAERFGWDEETYAWFCFLNGNTQNPITSLMLLEAAPSPAQAQAAVDFWRAEYARLEWDTDRRYHKRMFDVAVEGYLAVVGSRQLDYWRGARSWEGVWALATALPTFGRLSAWSYLEYLYLAGIHDHDASTLMLADRSGSRSHRNGLCIVSGRDEFDWHDSNPTFDGSYPPDLLNDLGDVGEDLLAAARARRPGDRAVSRLTLESALCTYKSWHRPRRRYPNVYADMHYNRVTRAEGLWPERDFGLWWEARSALLPAALRLEDNPYDPGLHPDKQDHYRLTGQVIVMDCEEPWAANDFTARVAAGAWGRCR
jgi:hypothetical protein